MAGSLRAALLESSLVGIAESRMVLQLGFSGLLSELYTGTRNLHAAPTYNRHCPRNVKPS